MTRNTNNNSDQVDVQLYDKTEEEFLYELLLYKKKDIITIQKKLGINNNKNQIVLNKNKKEKKTLEQIK